MSSFVGFCTCICAHKETGTLVHVVKTVRETPVKEKRNGFSEIAKLCCCFTQNGQYPTIYCGCTEFAYQRNLDYLSYFFTFKKIIKSSLSFGWCVHNCSEDIVSARVDAI